jgi:hypothetical protein
MHECRRIVRRMFSHHPSRYRRAYISAPLGLNLGWLPRLLLERDITWEWAKQQPERPHTPERTIAAADFLIGILNGTRGDYRVLYEAGMATGLGRPVLLIMTRARPLPIDLQTFSVAKVGLGKRRALAFQLDLFLNSPERSVALGEPAKATGGGLAPESKWPTSKFGRLAISELEQEICAAIKKGGGSALVQPKSESLSAYTPDLLAWLGNQDPTLLDPAVIEVKQRVAPRDALKVEERLLAFMAATGVRTGFIITAESPPKRKQVLPNIYWLELKRFAQLVASRNLPAHLRDARNRLMHGIE